MRSSVSTSSLTMASAAATLCLLQKQDPLALETTFQHLTAESLGRLDRQLFNSRRQERILPPLTESTSTSPMSPSSSLIKPASSSSQPTGAGIVYPFIPSGGNNLTDTECDFQSEIHLVIAKAIIRRIVHRCLDKYSEISSHETVEDALKYHTLPEELQKHLTLQLSTSSSSSTIPPLTWFDSLEQLRKKHFDDERTGMDDDAASRSLMKLWEDVLDHQMTSYVPMQCQSCGHVVPDDLRSTKTDEEIGLSEVDPTPDEAPYVRGGWFRGPRPSSKVLQLQCPACGSTTRWFRSRHPRIVLNPNKWGRLCGEQEDLRLDLASYLGVSIRTCLPLDWDHVWSEFSVAANREIATCSDDGQHHKWNLHDDNDRNFVARLDEGIGSFTFVWAISPNPDWCEDVTDSYLSCQNKEPPGRAQDNFHLEMEQYRRLIDKARSDNTGSSTQARTVYGYAIHRAGLTSDHITAEMKRAVKEYGTQPWYRLVTSDN